MFDTRKTSDTPRRTLALLLALTTALGPTAMPAFAASKPAAKPTKKDFLMSILSHRLAQASDRASPILFEQRKGNECFN